MTKNAAPPKPTSLSRLRWWTESRFGMFIHWGLFSQLGRHEWALGMEQIPLPEYEALADTWFAKPRPAREWARLAKKAGMKYMVFTAKHLEGYCLWDTAQTDFNSVQRTPGRDLVREYVDACREFGLKVGIYYCLWDWRHPDCRKMVKDKAARRRFLDFTQGCVRELMSNYGKIDIMWFDAPYGFDTAEGWESEKMIGMVRQLQPGILINNRAILPEDFGTPEEQITPESRPWEACMTFNGSWGYMPSAIDWKSVRDVLMMLRNCTAGKGNLLLNVGPRPDGSIPEEAIERLVPVGKWLAKCGEAVYGKVDPAYCIAGMITGAWTRKGKTGYFWVDKWPGKELVLARISSKVKSISCLATGKELDFVQQGSRAVIQNLPAKSPDKIAGVAVLKCEFASVPKIKDPVWYMH